MKTPYEKRALLMQKQYALNKQPTFLIPGSLLFVRLFVSSTVSQLLKALPTRK